MEAIFSATSLVVPVAEKYTTRTSFPAFVSSAVVPSVEASVSFSVAAVVSAACVVAAVVVSYAAVVTAALPEHAVSPNIIKAAMDVKIFFIVFSPYSGLLFCAMTPASSCGTYGSSR